MKRLLTAGALLAVLPISGCGEEGSEKQQEVIVVAQDAGAVSVEPVVKGAEVEPKDKKIDYGAVIDSEKGLAAVNAGKEAVISGVEALDKEQAEYIASQLAGQASVVVGKYRDNLPKSGQAALDAIGITGPTNKDWNVLETTGVRVIDGDTVEVLVQGAQSQRVRLLGIDAPEYSKNNPNKTQEYGDISTNVLQQCVDSNPVSIVYEEEDRYGRLLGLVMAGDTDCNFTQVQQGAAWHYKQYQSSQPSGHAARYAEAEKKAKGASLGLWAMNNPQPPWEFRKK